jgi:hypothetical protein
VIRTSVLGGETKSRGLLSGRRSKGVLVAWIIAAAVFAVLVMFLQLAGLLVAAPCAVVLLVLTMDTGTGSTPLRRVQDRRRMAYRRRYGFHDFIPLDWRPPGLTPEEARVEFNSYRELPDGVDGLYWLQSGPGVPAVAFHAGAGEAPYLSVAFRVDGPIQGLHGDAYVARAQAKFGELMAGWGASQKLVTGIQVLTRVLPTDSAYHEMWLQDELDPDAPVELQADYGALLDELSASGFVQRHFVVIRWDVDTRFTAIAGRRGPGLDGYLSLITSQLGIAQRRLVDAMYTHVRPLSGPQLAAVLRHLQHPGWPIDRASDVTVDTCWLPSHDEWSMTEVVSAAPDPLDPGLLLAKSSWFHRTAVIPVQALESRPLDGLWLSPLLTGLDEQIVRTLSTHIHFVPAREAKVGARRDATSDQAEIIAQHRKGQLIDDSTELALSAANRRYEDLRDGAGHHGAVWAAFLTISTRTVQELTEATAHLEEAADAAGIARLDWLDTRQSAAQATTWPLARGMAAPKRTTTAKALHRVGTSSSKEAL